ncbi:unnamed protein product [Orchesella dallaii]|uniref:Uncharacterized protein n=1 Tax=Orchesella dallaii TaxID=48710 RepID=A0ABP1QZN6_9HEXA
MCEKPQMDRNNEEVCAWAVILETSENGPIQKGVDIATSLRKVQTSKQIIALVKGDELCSEQLRNELLAEGRFNQVALISQEISDSFDAILDQVYQNIDNLMEKDNWLESVQENRGSNAKQFMLKDITLVCRNKGEYNKKCQRTD